MTRYQTVMGGSGFGSMNDPVLHFGLGAETQADTVSIRWPSGLVQEVRAVRADQLLVFTEGQTVGEKQSR
jgi:hypothetical protein